MGEKKIAGLTSQDVTGKNESISQAITQLGLQYRLLTSFTSMVAVDETVVTSGGGPSVLTLPKPKRTIRRPRLPAASTLNYGAGAMVTVTAERRSNYGLQRNYYDHQCGRSACERP